MTEVNEGGLPEESLAIADAMALRAGRIGAISEQILAALQGIEYEPKTPEEMRREHIGRTVLYMARIDDPTAPISWTELADAQHANGGYEQLAAGVEVDGMHPEAEGVRGLIHATIKEVQEGAGMSDEKSAQDFAKTLASARQVAKDHDTDVVTVYDSDELYFEASRRAFPIDETVDELSHAIDTVSGEMLNKVIVQQLENMLPKEFLEELDPEQLAKISAGMQLNAEVQAGLAQRAELLKESIRQTATYLITRIYGLDALNTLSTAQKLTLMPRKPLVSVVFDEPTKL